MVLYYLNSELFTARDMRGSAPWRFGHATIGNWDQPLSGSPTSIRNLNGRLAELMVFREALSAEEIARLALK